MWTPATRKQYSRPFLRYQSDATDEEWRMFEPFLPAAKRSVDHRPVASRDRQWNFLCHAFRLPMAPVAEGYAAVEQGLPLVRGLARCLRVREDQSLAGHAQAGTGRARGQSFDSRPIIEKTNPTERLRREPIGSRRRDGIARIVR